MALGHCPSLSIVVEGGAEKKGQDILKIENLMCN